MFTASLYISYFSKTKKYVHNSIFIAIVYATFSTDEDDLDTIVSELHDVTDILKLGLALGIRKSTLDKIVRNYTSLEDRKIEVIHYWLTRRDIVRPRQGECPDWNGLAVAVARVNPALSLRIRHQHC